MMPLVNKPLMEHIVTLLARHGFDDVVVTVAYLANQIRDYFGDGSDFGIRMRYATDESPLGTAGSVRNAAAELDDTFLVISGDVLTDIDLSRVVNEHRESGATASIALKRVENPLEFGIVITRPDGSIERFLEKGLTLHGHVAEGYWEDIGTTDAYLSAHTDVLNGSVKLDISGFELRKGVWLGEGAEVDPDADVQGPAVIGDNCRIEAGAKVTEYSVLGTDVVVKSDATIERAVCHDHVYIGRAVRLRGCVVGRSSDLRSHARLEEGVVVGDECFIGEHAV